MNTILRLAVALALGAAAPAIAQAPPAPVAGASVEANVQVCVTCHGPNGNSTNPTHPTLAGQNARYLYLQLKDFKEGRRQDPQMSPMAAPLGRDDMLALADYFSKQKQAPGGFNADAAKVAAGRKKSEEVLCPMCHRGDFVGQNEIPRVAGQQYAYVKKQLSDFKARRRTNDAGNMTSVAGTLSGDDIENLAQYIANLY
ncbi:MAG TPA: c-type cytochrome [Casimicrobiaceae bacterium]